jgi:hypothetical protein
MRPAVFACPPTVRASAALVAFAVIVAVAPAAGRGDDPSFRAGYAAVSSATDVRSALSELGMSYWSYCDLLFKDELGQSKSIIQHHAEFLRGCGIAVGDAME